MVSPYNRVVDITDDRGRALEEVTLRLNPQEVADLLVGASSIDDGAADHAVVRDPDSGRSVALYLAEEGEPTDLERQTDWWVGPIVLVVVLFVAVGPSPSPAASSTPCSSSSFASESPPFLSVPVLILRCMNNARERYSAHHSMVLLLG